MSDTTLDNIRLGKDSKEHDLTRFQKIEEERLNRNFRKLKEDIESLTGELGTLSDSIRVGDNIEFHETVDIVPRRAYATLSSAGWYRVLAIDSTAQRTPNSRFQSDIVNFRITTSRGSGNKTEEHLITLFNGSHDTHFADESSASSDLVIDKIRTTALYVDNISTNSYVDIHFIGSTTTEVSVYFDVYVLPSVQTAFQSVNMLSVVDAPSGETIVTTHYFNSGNVLTATGTSAVTLPSTWGEIIVDARFGGNVLYGFSFCVSHKAMFATTERYIQGAYYSSSDYHRAIIEVSSTYVKLISWHYNGTDYTSSSKINVICK